MAITTEQVIIQVELQGQQDAQKRLVELTSATNKLAMERREMQKQLNALQADEKANAAEIQRVSDALTRNKQVSSDLTNEMRGLNNMVKATSGSLNAQRTALNALLKEFDNTPKASPKIATLRKEIEKLSAEIKDSEQSTGRFQRNVGNYGDALRGLGASLREGNFKGAAADAKDLFSTIGAAGLAGGAIGLAAQAVAGAIGGIIEYGKEIAKLRGEISRLTGASGADLDAQAAKVSSIAKTFEQDSKEITQAANTLSKELGISFTEAAQLISDGFAAGADTSGEFLDSIKEYPAQFAKMGISAEQTVAIISQAARSGVYSDKAADALKEGMLTVTAELSTGAKAALKAVGINGEEMQRRIKAGTITAFEGLQEISGAIKKLPADSKEYGEVVTQVFRGAGEDAGQFVAKLDEVPKSMNEVIDLAGGYAKAMQDSAKASENLALVTQQAFGESSSALVQFGVAIKTFFVNALAETVSFIDKSAKGIQTAKAYLFGTEAEYNALVARNRKEQDDARMKALQKERDERLKIEDPKRYEALLKARQAKEAAANPLAKQKPTAKGASAETKAQIGSLEQLTKAAADLKKTIESTPDMATRIAKTAELEKVETRIKAINKEIQDALHPKVVAPIVIPIDVESNIDTEANVPDVVEAIKNKAHDAEEARQKQEIQWANDTADAKIAAAQREADAERQLDETRNARIMAIGQAVSDIASSVANYQQAAQSKALADFDAAGQKRLQAVEGNAERTKQVEADLLKEREAMEREYAIRNAKMQIVQAGIAGAMAVMSILAAPTIDPTGILKGIQIAAAVATTAIQIAAIEKGMQGFADGGKVLSGKRITSNDGKPIRRSNGDNLLATVKTNEVILNEQQQQALGGADTFRRLGVPGFASGGIVGNTIPPINGGAAYPINTSQYTLMQAVIATSKQNPIVYVQDITQVGDNLKQRQTRAKTR